MTALIDQNYSLIPPGDPRYFAQTCYKPYNRHKYKIHMESGKVEVIEFYDEVYARWMQSPYCKYVEVIDKKSKYR